MCQCVYSAISLFGAGLGQVTGSLIAQYTTWRWVFGVQAIMGGAMCIILLFVAETRSTVILRRKAKLLNSYQERLEATGYEYSLPAVGQRKGSQDEDFTPVSQRIRWFVPKDEERASFKQLMQVSLVRPFRFLFTEPVVFFFSLWIAFSWAVLYSFISALPMVFQEKYRYNLSQANAPMTAECAGCISGAIIFILQDYVAKKKLGWGEKGSPPEHRLYFSCVESLCLPIGLFLFGWSSQYRAHWVVPSFGVGIATIGIFSIYLAVCLHPSKAQYNLISLC